MAKQPKPIFAVGDEVILIDTFRWQGEDNFRWQDAIQETPGQGSGVVVRVEWAGGRAGWEYQVNYGPRPNGIDLMLWTDPDRLSPRIQEEDIEETIASILRGLS